MEGKFAIAECFHSLQGEGQWVGTPMYFVRLAGCSVGKPVLGEGEDSTPQLSTGAKAWQCRAVSGAHFWCDTDFHKRVDVSPADLVLDCFESHLCLTGGEPLMEHNHPLIVELDRLLRNKRKQLHIETSGTIIPPPMKNEFGEKDYWLTCSPKWDVKPRVVEMADEIKLLVDESFNPEHLPACIKNHELVFLSPINPAVGLDEVTLTIALRVLEDYPHWRLSVQLHKILGMR